MKIASIHTHTEENCWDSLVQSSQNATSYHQFGWKSVVSKSFGHECHYLAAIDDKGGWQGVLPLVHMRSILFGNFLVSVPFASYGGLLCKSEEAASLLLNEAEKLRRFCGATHVELRHLAHNFEGLPSIQYKVTMILDLAADIDTQWAGFNAKLRNQIRKAEKSDLRSVVGNLELLNGFYDVFARNMRDLGTPVHAKCFFRNTLEKFSDTTKIIAIYHKEKIIAAGIIFWFRDTMEMPWASSISDYKAFCPNNMLYWEAIKLAIGQGFSRFDFGRSTPYEGTYNFKKQWGAKPVQLYWQYLMNEKSKMPEAVPLTQKYRTAIRVWQHLPVLVTRVIGPILRKHISL